MDGTAGCDEYESIAELYDHVVPYAGRQDVDFFVQEALASGGPVLELGCGTGRILIPTARAGIDIVGIDRSARMLDVCRRRLELETEPVRSRAGLVAADMRQFELGQRFRLVSTPFRPFQHLLTVADQLSCLRCVHRHLDDGGRFILDIFNPYLELLVQTETGVEQGDEPDFVLPDGRRVVRRYRFVSFDRFNQVNQVEMIYYVNYPDGRSERLVHSIQVRYLFRFEAEHLLARGGFRVEQVYADYDRSPLGAKYPGELIVVATKSCCGSR